MKSHPEILGLESANYPSMTPIALMTLHCASMAHVIDRATAFRFCGEPYTTLAVTPDSIIIGRHLGSRFDRIEIKAIGVGR